MLYLFFALALVLAVVWFWLCRPADTLTDESSRIVMVKDTLGEWTTYKPS